MLLHTRYGFQDLLPLSAKVVYLYEKIVESLIWAWAVCLGMFGRQLEFKILEHLPLCVFCCQILQVFFVSFLQISHDYAGLQIRVCIGKKKFLYFSFKTYVVGTEKNRLNETVLLSTQNTCLN